MSDNLIPLISKSAGIAQVQMKKEIEGRLPLLNKSNAFNQVHKEVFIMWVIFKGAQSI
jgi:hypothetical protein